MHPIAPVRPRIDRGLARRLDRLAFRAHAFHRWAHHPLCLEYESEVVRLGRRFRLCRGCAAAALGGATGLAVGLLAPALPSGASLCLALLGVLAGGFSLARQRLPKTLTRALPMAPPPLLLIQALRFGGLAHWGLTALAGAAVAAGIAAYRRRGPDRTPCTTCPEFMAGGTCRGFREIHTRERAFARLATRWFRPADPVR